MKLHRISDEFRRKAPKTRLEDVLRGRVQLVLGHSRVVHTILDTSRDADPQFRLQEKPLSGRLHLQNALHRSHTSQKALDP